MYHKNHEVRGALCSIVVQTTDLRKRHLGAAGERGGKGGEGGGRGADLRVAGERHARAALVDGVNRNRDFGRGMSMAVAWVHTRRDRQEHGEQRVRDAGELRGGRRRGSTTPVEGWVAWPGASRGTEGLGRRHRER